MLRGSSSSSSLDLACATGKKKFNSSNRRRGASHLRRQFARLSDYVSVRRFAYVCVLFARQVSERVRGASHQPCILFYLKRESTVAAV